MLPWTGLRDRETEVSQTCGNVRAAVRRVGAGGGKRSIFAAHFFSCEVIPIGLLDLANVWRGGRLLSLRCLVNISISRRGFLSDNFLSTFLFVAHFFVVFFFVIARTRHAHFFVSRIFVFTFPVRCYFAFVQLFASDFCVPI